MAEIVTKKTPIRKIAKQDWDPLFSYVFVKPKGTHGIVRGPYELRNLSVPMLECLRTRVNTALRKRRAEVAKQRRT